MDPVCHTLAGAALGEAGLRRLTPLAVPTLLIGANLPDIDMASYFWGPGVPLAFRRGWTHGALALIVLPLVLTAVMILFDRIASRASPARPAAAPGALLLLATASVASHPLLDLLNIYGVRLLMPMADRWFYGDTLFIVDPWVWLALGAGVWLSRRWRRHERGGAPRPARAALLGVAVYALFMAATGLVARRAIAEELRVVGLPWQELMVAPVPLNPLERQIVIESHGAFRLGTVRLIPARLTLDTATLPKHDRHPAARAAAGTPEGRRFLTWSRFPYYLIDSSTVGSYDVRIMDARYNSEWASVRVRLFQLE